MFYLYYPRFDYTFIFKSKESAREFVSLNRNSFVVTDYELPEKETSLILREWKTYGMATADPRLVDKLPT